MLNLILTTDKISVITSSGADIDVHVSGVDCDDTTLSAQVFTEFKQNTQPTTATTTDIVDVPASSHRKNVKFISIRNIDGSVSNDVTVQFNQNGTLITLFKCTLLAAEELVCREGAWFHYDSNGGLYGGIPVATQADMESGSSLTAVATPGRLQYHPGVAKAWGKANGAGTSLLVNYNCSGIADTNTGRLGVNIGTDMSSADYSIVANVERTVTALTATGVEDHAIRNASPAAGSFEIESYDHTAITFAAQDPQSYFWACFGDQ